MTRPFATVVLLLLVFPPAVRSATAPIATDRPGFTYSPRVVPENGAQLEAGVLWEKEEGMRSVSAPEGLVRWGVSPGFELRLGLPNYTDTELDSGLGDTSVGAKVELARGRGIDVGAVATVTLPTGEDGFGSEEAQPGIVITASRDLDPRWSIGGQIGAASIKTNERRFLWSATLVAGRAITPRWGTFLELAGEIDDAGNGQLVVHHGHAFPVTSSFQLDVHGGLGLTFDAPDAFLGAGIAARR